MEKIANEQLASAAKFYKSMGVSADEFMQGENIRSIFDFLGIKPELDANGNRKLTPYEILGVLPNIQSGIEKPIVFFVKNKIKNIKLTKPKVTQTFVFPKTKNKEENSLIDFVLASYKSAVAQNNLSEAERQYDMLDKLTGGRASHYLIDFYDYTKFYRQMKKQLLIDLFSHFFLIYLMEQKSIIKRGLIIKNRTFKPFVVNKQPENVNATELPQIKSVRVDDIAETIDSSPTKNSEEINKDISFDESLSKARISSEKQDNVISKQSIIEKVEKNAEPVLPEKKSFINKIRKHLFRKNKKRIVPEVQNIQKPKTIIELKNKPEREKEVVYE